MPLFRRIGIMITRPSVQSDESGPERVNLLLMRRRMSQVVCGYRGLGLSRNLFRKLSTNPVKTPLKVRRLSAPPT